MSENNTITITRMNIINMSSLLCSRSRSRKRYYRNSFRKLVCLVCCECKNIVNFDGRCLCECHEDSFNKNT